MIYRYFSIVLASFLLLAGLQVPSFVDQYEKRVDAHLVEAAENLKGFQEIADRYYNGSLQALIEKHEASNDTTFREESEPIADIYARYRLFKAQKEALGTGLAGRVRFIALHGNDDLLRETVNTYTYTVTLNEDAALSGIILVVAGLLLADLSKLTVSWGIRRRRARRRPGPDNSRPQS